MVHNTSKDDRRDAQCFVTQLHDDVRSSLSSPDLVSRRLCRVRCCIQWTDGFATGVVGLLCDGQLAFSDRNKRFAVEPGRKSVIRLE